jgi:hypothetical protein
LVHGLILYKTGQAIDGSPVPAAAKASLRTKLAALQKRVLEDQKAAAAANKARGTASAVAAADAAVAAGHKFVVVQLQIGLDAKAAMEAWNAVHKKHPSLPAAILTADQSKHIKLCSHITCQSRAYLKGMCNILECLSCSGISSPASSNELRMHASDQTGADDRLCRVVTVLSCFPLQARARHLHTPECLTLCQNS